MLDSAKVDALANKIFDLLGDDFDGAVGLRGDDHFYKVNSEVKNSYYWQDGVKTSQKLNGTSAIVVSADYAYDPASLIKDHLKKYAQLVANYGSSIYIVAGDIASGGEDIGEIVIPNARVITLIDRSEIVND